MTLNAKRKIIFHHLPKTGGTSLISKLDESYDLNKTLTHKYWGVPAINVRKKDIEKDLSTILNNELIHGHFPVSYFNKYFEEYYRVTVLRNPYDRIFSLFNDWKNKTPDNLREAHPQDIRTAERAQSMDIYSFLVDRTYPINCLFDNGQTRQLSGNIDGDILSDVDLQKAIVTIDQMDLIGITEMMKMFTQNLYRECGLDQELELTRHNQRTYKKENRITDIIQECSKWDWKLYKYVQNKISQNITSNQKSSRKKIKHQSEYSNDIRIDMRMGIKGDNWHIREDVGTPHVWRWSGPDTTSTIELNLKPNYSDYTLSIMFISVIDSAILDGMNLYINDHTISWKKEGIENGQQKIVANINKEHITVGNDNLSIEVPYTIAHSDKDPSINDTRKKGLAITTINITSNVSPNYKRLIHQHQIKTGGTSVNAYFGNKYEAKKVLDPAIIGEYKRQLISNIDGKVFPKDEELIEEELAYFRNEHYEYINGHSPLNWLNIGDDFTFTFIRNPVERVLSQIRDWKQLDLSTFSHLPKDNREFKQLVKKESVLTIMQNINMSNTAITNLRNLQCKSLARSIIGPNKSYEYTLHDCSSEQLFSIAIEALKYFSYVGLTENLNQSIINICSLNGFCPPNQVSRLNKSKKLDEVINTQTINIIKENNEADIRLYQYIIDHYNQNDIESYDINSFEIKYAFLRTKKLTPIKNNNNTFLFDFNQVIIGNGFHPRDAANTPECAIWTGPEVSTNLFFPIIKNLKCNILLYIKGYADDSLRSNYELKIDNEKLEYKTLATKDEVDVIIEIPYKSLRDFIRLEIIVPATFDNENDSRKRGLSLLKYGYRIGH